MVTSYINNTGIENIQNFTGFLATANSSAGGTLFAGIDLLVFAILFISMAATIGWQAAILSSGFIAMILSFLFVYMGVLSMTFAGYFVGILVVIMMYTIYSKRG